MADTPQVPPSAGWYSVAGNPDELAYFDGRWWTWRRWRLPTGEWQQEPIVSPSPTLPTSRAAYPPYPAQAQYPGTATPGFPGYPGGPAYPGYAGGPSYYAEQPGFAPPGRVDFHLTEPQRQARWKTLLRALLAIPNVIVLSFVGIAVFFVTVVMWFAALFTARVPEGMWRFSTGAVQWQARLTAYAAFLTDKYPPFELGDVPDHPVSMRLSGPPDRFNRWSVLFRAILVIPAAIVAEVYSFGMAVFCFVAWLATLVTGRCPRALHLALAAWIRYNLRYTAYYLLLTTVYPSAPLGDRLGDSTLTTGRIVLRGASKGFAVTALVLGSLLYVTDLALPAAFGRTEGARARSAVTQWNALNSRGLAAASSYRAKVATCANQLPCLESATPILVQSLDTQIASLRAIKFPTSATQDLGNRILSVLGQEKTVLTTMESAPSPQAFQADANSLVALTQQLQPLGVELARDLDSLV